MNPEIPLAYLHFVALIGTASLLVAELVLCRPGMRGDTLHRLRRVDGFYAMFAVGALATGAMRLFWGAKGSAYYFSNPVFHAKFGLFVLIGLMSILPTVRFTAWSRAVKRQSGFTPDPAALSRVRSLLRAELLLLALMPLLAAMMARGVTSFH